MMWLRRNDVSVDFGGSEIRYSESGKTITLVYERLIGDIFDRIVYLSEVTAWDPPHDCERLTAEDRARIKSNIDAWFKTIRIEWDDESGVVTPVKLNDLRSLMTDLECQAFSPVSAIDAALLDVRRSTVRRKADLVIVDIVAAQDACCPFRLFLGRGRSRHKIGIFAGHDDLGDHFELSDYEDLEVREVAQEIHGLIEDFLRSRVECRAYENRNGKRVSASYRLDRFTMDGRDSPFAGGDWLPAILGRKRTIIDFEPWLPGDDPLQTSCPPPHLDKRSP